MRSEEYVLALLSKLTSASHVVSSAHMRSDEMVGAALSNWLVLQAGESS
jgi:hypothetical protein